MESNYYDKVDPDEIIEKLNQIIERIKQSKEDKKKHEEKLSYPHPN